MTRNPPRSLNATQPAFLGRRPMLRRGYSMVEIQIAFAVFGVILAGLCPIVVAQLRHVKLLESRFQPGVSYYVTPRANPWIQKLAGTATVTTSAPVSLTSGSSGANIVTIHALDASPNVEDATATVQVTPLVGH